MTRGRASLGYSFLMFAGIKQPSWRCENAGWCTYLVEFRHANKVVADSVSVSTWRRHFLSLQGHLGWLCFGLAATVHGQSVDAFNPTMLQDAYGLAVQADGKILVSGFAWIRDDRTAGTTLLRLNSAGTLDGGFLANSQTNYVWATCFVVQPDGKILTAGVDTGSIVRLNADGSMDPGFNAAVQFGIHSMVMQPDGKIIVGGDFEQANGAPRSYLARLNPDGSLDGGFTPEPDYSVNALALQPDGKILVGGVFESFGGQTQTNIGRLNPDGTLDRSFNPAATAGGRWFGNVECFAVQPDGRILVGGSFNVLCGQNRTNLARLNADGSLDLMFKAQTDGFAYHPVTSLLLQADGKLIVAGEFTSLAGGGSGHLARLKPDGTVDSSFSNPAGYVEFAGLQSDGKILAGGWFDPVNSQPQKCLLRLDNTEPATDGLTFDGSNLTWVRGGAAPEIWRATFESSTNGGLSWAKLGDGVRIPGGWQIPGIAVSSNSSFRARGYTVGGAYNASSWFVETINGLPVILTGPVSITNNAGTTAEFMVYAGGSSLSYRWLKNGAPLADNAHISGSATADLVITNVLGADAGGYSVVVSGGSASITSIVATLTVVDPLIVDQPASQIGQLGGALTFSVQAIGTAPLAYQWRKNGADLAGATGSAVTLTNLLASDGGMIDVVVSNVWGTATSAPARLTVNLAVADSFSAATEGLGMLSWSDILALGLQPDGQILLGGQFLKVNGHARTNLARLEPDGALDLGFTAQAAYGPYYGQVNAFAIQADHKILVGGSFTNLAGEYRANLGRLNPDGAADPSFSASSLATNAFAVYTIAVQPDGKVLVGGTFVAGGYTNLVRLNPDGAIDTSFVQPPLQLLSFPYPDPALPLALALQPDGKILVAGFISTCGGAYQDVCEDFTFLERLEPDGTLDTNFAAVPNPAQGPVMGHIESLAIQPDGRLLVAGPFGGVPLATLVRLNLDGTVDTSFNPAINGEVKSIALQANGQIIVAGAFDTVGGLSCSNIARVNSDGSVDGTFVPDLAYTIDSMAATVIVLQADGRLLVGGSFTNLAGQSITNLGRLENPTPATQELSFNGSTLTWVRGGSSPELWRTTFEYSIDGNSWTNIGDGERISNGWQITGFTSPPNATFRARGFPTGASALFETLLSPWLAISNFSCSAAGQVAFDIVGRASEPFVIETSPDLRTWSTLQTGSLTTATVHFTDPQPATLSARYYRLRLTQ